MEYLYTNIFVSVLIMSLIGSSVIPALLKKHEGNLPLAELAFVCGVVWLIILAVQLSFGQPWQDAAAFAAMYSAGAAIIGLVIHALSKRQGRD